ncbi:hypothetical protein [Methylobacterium sp. sgz302541]|uniref:hypothetical protein n=1 Tax=unclassified Methylobacterium TaxID=2615210 RepID=UPI003D32583B
MTSLPLDRHAPETAGASRPVRAVRRTGGRRGRPVEKARILAVAGVGVAVIGGFAGAMSLLSGLAAPPPRPVMVINTPVAEWPDLRDGVPALARPADAKPRMAEPAAVPASVPAPAPASLRAALDPAPDPAPVAPPPAPGAKSSGRMLPLENARLVAPQGEAASVVSAPRGVALLRPLASETVKARTAAASTFTALAPEDTTASVAEPAREPVTPREAVKPRIKAVSVKPARAPAAESPAPAASAAADTDSDETEVLGVKIPSLAATGRKLREALGGGDSAASE